MCWSIVGSRIFDIPLTDVPIGPCERGRCEHFRKLKNWILLIVNMFAIKFNEYSNAKTCTTLSHCPICTQLLLLLFFEHICEQPTDRCRFVKAANSSGAGSCIIIRNNNNNPFCIDARPNELRNTLCGEQVRAKWFRILHILHNLELPYVVRWVGRASDAPCLLVV